MAAVISTLRADERSLIASAGAVFALASAGAAMSAAAADAMFLAELGPAHLGEAVAASSALLAIVLAVVGGLADRIERRRVLAGLAVISAVVLAGLAGLAVGAPRLAAGTTLIAGKQLAAATDLAFWVVVAERLDARRSRRLLPLLAATGGAGAAIGAVLVVPLAQIIGARGVLLGAAAMLVLAAGGAARLPATRRLAAPSRPLIGLLARSWRDGARVVRRHALARHLAIVVAAAGAFASLVYYALGAAAAAHGGAAAELAALLGGVRGAAQLVTLAVQLVLAPWLLARLGTGYALLLAPLVALAAGLGLVIAPILAVAIAAQISARVLDAGIETPAEKLAQTLLPGAVRGRVAGFLDGTAKRAGAVLGGLVAAVLTGAPAVFYGVVAGAAAVWLACAAWIARELPALAIDHAARDVDPDAVVDDRAVALLVRELAGPRPQRAAELLCRLHGRARLAAVGPLVEAATTRGGPSLWRALIAVLEEPAGHHAAAIAAAVAAGPGDPELAVRAVGLAGGVTGDAEMFRIASGAADDAALGRLAPGAVGPAASLWYAGADAALALTAAVARDRLAGNTGAVLATLDDGLRDGLAAARTGQASRAVVVRVVIDELCVELARWLAAGELQAALEAARRLARALRRSGDAAQAADAVWARAAGFAALGRVIQHIRDQRSAELSLLRADVLELARERVEAAARSAAPASSVTSLSRPARGHDDAPEIAAALRLYGDLLEGAELVPPEDLRRLASALGDPDDDVRGAAEAALIALGSAATGELVAAAAWGRRHARDRAAALLAALPVTAAALERLIAGELAALDRTHAAIAALGEPGDALLARRLDERLGEIAHTVLLLVAASRRSPAIARAAVAWRHARGRLERARTLAVIDTALPGGPIGRLVDAVDALTPAERAAAVARSGIAAPSRDAVIRGELAGTDRLARALALHALDAAERGAHRETIAQAAHAEAIALSPRDLVHKLSHALDHRAAPAGLTEDEGADMPSRVETLIALGRVPLLASLTTRQLADVAERARWTHARAGALVVLAGDLIDALIVVEDGALALGDRRIDAGEVVDELACVAPVAATSDLRVVHAARLIRLERIDFEELVDDVPGLAAAVCRALGERARRAENAAYRSPLGSRG